MPLALGFFEIIAIAFDEMWVPTNADDGSWSLALGPIV